MLFFIDMRIIKNSSFIINELSKVRGKTLTEPKGLNGEWLFKDGKNHRGQIRTI
jgi:hypothetical protein